MGAGQIAENLYPVKNLYKKHVWWKRKCLRTAWFWQLLDGAAVHEAVGSTRWMHITKNISCGWNSSWFVGDGSKRCNRSQYRWTLREQRGAEREERQQYHCTFKHPTLTKHRSCCTSTFVNSTTLHLNIHTAKKKEKKEKWWPLLCILFLFKIII